MSHQTTKTYAVQGMTCDHCRAAVAEHVSALAGVDAVDVDVPAGEVTVSGRDVDDAAIRAAVHEAGYAVR
jgi:copper chaperone CopZ